MPLLELGRALMTDPRLIMLDNVGAVLGAALVLFLMEGTRFATGWLGGLKPVQVAALRETLIGAALLLVLRVRPRGLLPERIVPVGAPR